MFDYKYVKATVLRHKVVVTEMEYMNTRRGKATGRAGPKRTASREEKESNYTNAQKRKGKFIRALMDINFESMQSTFATLTFQNQPETVEQCNRKLYNLIRGLHKRYNSLRYLAVLEMDAKKRLHYHMILNAVCTRELENDIVTLWTHGFEKMAEPVMDVWGLSWYMTKQMESETNHLFGHKRYLYSRELTKPATVHSWDTGRDKELADIILTEAPKGKLVSEYHTQNEYAGKTGYMTYDADMGFYGVPVTAVRK